MIRCLRLDHGWSQGRLAEKLNMYSGRDTATRHDVYRWESGKRVPLGWLPSLAGVLGVSRETLEQAVADTRRESQEHALARFLPSDTDPLRPLRTTRTGHRVGVRDLDDVFARIHGLRLADDVISGGDLAGPAFRELRSVLRLHREGTHTERVENALLVAVGELAQITGWIASDAGHRMRAEGAYRLGVGAARQAGDRVLAGNLLGSLAYHLVNTGYPGAGLALAEAGVAETGSAAVPRARALAWDRLAWAHALAGQVAPTGRALGRAQEALAAYTAGEEDPGYLYWVTAEELQIMEARCFTELGRPLRAVPRLTGVLERYDPGHTRELVLYLSWLSVAYCDANEPEAAAQTAQRMISLAGDLASDRTAARVGAVTDRLRRFATVPVVRDVLCRVSSAGVRS